jgi:hypothetical protein
MNEKKVLDSIRKYTLWAVLGSAALLLVLEILKAWDVIKTTSGGGMMNLGADALSALMGGSLDGLGEMMRYSAPSANAWGHIEETLGIIVMIGALVLLALLVSSRTKVGDVKDAKVAAAPAKAPTAEAPGAKAGAAKPKK